MNTKPAPCTRRRGQLASSTPRTDSGRVSRAGHSRHVPSPAHTEDVLSRRMLVYSLPAHSQAGNPPHNSTAMAHHLSASVRQTIRLQLKPGTTCSRMPGAVRPTTTTRHQPVRHVTKQRSQPAKQGWCQGADALQHMVSPHVDSQHSQGLLNRLLVLGTHGPAAPNQPVDSQHSSQTRHTQPW